MGTTFATIEKRLARNRHALLFTMLIATIALGPLLSLTESGGTLLNVFLGLTLLSTTLTPMRDRVAARAHAPHRLLASARRVRPRQPAPH